ncbi:FecR domain-containing protein [Niabella hibiscisoli]|nr:FecR domain-containing protein [Niabella hibiscisoli]
MPGSSLSYPDTFTSDKRLVSLTGEAVFHVAKNKEMPFVVNSGTISTTALGTVFKVKSHQKSNHIEVSLLEGRVVVRALHAGSKFKDIYLKPGETVTYNKTLEIGAIAASPASHKDKPGKIFVPDARTTNTQSYWFQNEPLAKVFDRFSNMYHLTIRYDKAELKNMTFTARLKKKIVLTKCCSLLPCSMI